jgi:hypothetical protein
VAELVSREALRSLFATAQQLNADEAQVLALVADRLLLGQ